MLGRRLQIVQLIVALTLITLTICQTSIAETQTSPMPGSAVHIEALSSEEYAYASRAIPEIAVNNSLIEFQALVKILRFQSTPAGIVLQIDLRGHGGADKNQELRYSFRFANDGSVIFYYPFMNSTAAVTKRDGWIPGKWCRLASTVSEDSGKFYIDNILVEQNDPQHPANSAGYDLSNLGLGKGDKQKLSVEAFVTDITVSENKSVRFSEDFRNDLKGYETNRSLDALLQVIDPSRYASIQAYVTPTTASLGENVRLHANLLDSSLKGIGNRSVTFEYQSGANWTELTVVQTSDNGTAESNWKIPSRFRNPIFIRGHFKGDNQFSEASSVPFSIVLWTQAQSQFELENIVLPLYGLALVATLLLAFRFGRKVLQGLISVLCSFILLLSLPILTNSIGIKSYIAYTPNIVQLQFFGPHTDELLWVACSLTVAAAWIALHNRVLLRRGVTMLPILLIFSSLAFYLLGIQLAAASFGIISAVVTAFFPLLLRGDEVVESPEGLALGFVASLLATVLVTELGSAAGWLYNTLDPHVPFDGEPRWLIASLEARLLGVLYPVALPALAALMFSWLWIPCLRSLAKQLGFSAWLYHQENVIPRRMSTIDKPLYSINNDALTRSSRNLKYLVYLTIPGIVCSSLFLVYYPYFYTTRLIGVDTPWYYQNLVSMSTSEGFHHIVSSYGGASRVPYLLILYAIKVLTSFPADLVVKIGPAVPATFVGAATLLLFRTITRDDVLASFSAFIGLFSIATTVGIFAGTFANWLALGWTALFFSLLVLMWRQPSNSHVLMAVCGSVVTLVIHAWTWAVVLAALGVYVVSSLLRTLITKRALPKSQFLKSSIIVVAANLALLLLVIWLFSTGEFIRLASEGLASISLNNLSNFLTIYGFTFQYYVGGFFANPFLILLSLVGLASARGFNSNLSRLLFSLLFVTSIPLLVETSFWQWRLLYMVPYQILAVFGASTVSKRFVGLGGRLGELCEVLFMVTFLFVSLNYALRCLNYIPS